MSKEPNNDTLATVQLTTRGAFISVCALFSLGAGTFGVVSPKVAERVDRSITSAAIESCIDKSGEALRFAADAIELATDALNVTSEHATAINKVEQNSADRYRRRGEAASEFWAKQQERDSQQDRRDAYIERQLDRLEEYVNGS